MTRTPDNSIEQQIRKLGTLAGIEVIVAKPNLITLAVRCDFIAADRLIQFMKSIMTSISDASLTPEMRQQVDTAFRELLVNALEHGGQFNPERYVELSYVRTLHVVMIRIKDPGDGFTLDELKHAAIANPPDDPRRHVRIRRDRRMRKGGYGILVASGFLDDVIYGEKGNEVLLIKYLSADDAPKP